MSVQKFDQWAKDRLVQVYPLSILKDAVIGIDASFYLDLRLNGTPEEPLKHALGGLPFCLTKVIEDDIQTLHEAGVTPIFVFNGLDFVNKTLPDSRSVESIRAQDEAWHHYLSLDSKATVADFSRAKYPVETMCRYLQKLLVQHKVDYQVAPYSAVAQLSYLLKLPEQYIDAVMGSTELFLFGVDKVVTDFNVNSLKFDWISKSSCDERFKASSDLFRDAQLLLGTSYLPTFPILEQMAATKQVGISDAISLLNNAGRSVLQLCNFHREHPQLQALQYADRYKKAVMTIRHHVVLEKNGVVAPLDFDRAPGDVHEFVGHRLPEELFFYISKGILGPQIPNWLTSEEIDLSLPGGVLDSEPYRRLVIEQLNPLRTEALKMLAESLNYYYQSRSVKLKTWDGRDTSNLTIEIKDTAPLISKLSQWKVRGSLLDPAAGTSGHHPTFLACLQSLKDKDYAAKTITKTRVEYPALRSKDEIVANTIWRFLQTRDFIDEKHELTPWGLALESALAAVDGGISEEGAILAVEMLRLGLFNGNSVVGTSVSKTDKSYQHKVNTNLISKVACLGRIRHKPMGWVGPLDRQLLSFAWMITAVRTSLRDLIETVLVSMFLSGEVERSRDDWFELAQSLPFAFDNGSGLGIAVKTYLDALNEESEITEELKAKVKAQEEKYGWFQQVKGGTLTKSLDTAWKLWDVVYAGAQHAGKDFKDTKLFSDANDWLALRR